MKVLKFGGTSLGNAKRMQNIAQIVSEQGKVLVVLSAVAGTTDALVEIVSAAKEQNTKHIHKVIEGLKSHYQEYVKALFDIEHNRSKADALINAQLSDLLAISLQAFTASLEFRVLAKGEQISTELFYLYLKQNNNSVKLLSALDFLRLNEAGEPDENYLAEMLNPIINDDQQVEIFITQGFICRNVFGDIYNLKRGGSDYSASLFSVALNCEEIQIWTDINGMHNNDPRFVNNTQPIRELSFDEAAELAYFGAKILHPASIKPARRKNIPVKLLNTLEPTALGTLISNKSSRAEIKAVAAKSGITAIKIRSSEMLQAPGFLRRIFEVFEIYKTSIDMITTSEVAVSVTIDDTSSLQSIVDTLTEFGHVEVDEGLSIICVVGAFLIENQGIASKVIKSVEGIPLRMISYGGSAHNISLLVSEELKVKTLNALHQGLFNV